MRRTTVAIALALAALFTVGAPAADACQGANVPAGSQPPASASEAVICLINHQRARYHLRRLHGSVALGSAAQLHSDAMASQDFFSHDGGGDGNPASRAAAAGYMAGARDWGVGENLGYGAAHDGSPKALVRSWMHSSAHRGVMLERFWRHVGVGATEGSPLGADGPRMLTFTADFGYRRG